MRESEKLQIIYLVCEKELGGMDSKTRIRDEVFKRWVFFKVAKDLTFCGQVEISGKVDRDHAGFIHAMKQFDYDILGNEMWRSKYVACRRKSAMELSWYEEFGKKLTYEQEVKTMIEKKLAAINRTVKSLKGFRYDRTRIKY